MMLKYFAYGSNMSLPRLGARTPGARRLGMCVLELHALRFHKLSEADGSGKCDAYYTGEATDRVIGALFEIPVAERPALDRVEGLGRGYLDKMITVHDATGVAHEAFTYWATNIDPQARPFSWYHHHVLHGALETGVPEEYLALIRAVDSTEDPDRKRDARERAIYST